MSRKPITEQNYKRFEVLSIFLKELRVSSGITQQELVNLHRNSVSRAENFHNMTLSTLFQLADAYEISLSQLFQDIE